jgi:hypothetical protein
MEGLGETINRDKMNSDEEPKVFKDSEVFALKS